MILDYGAKTNDTKLSDWISFQQGQKVGTLYSLDFFSKEGKKQEKTLHCT